MVGGHEQYAQKGIIACNYGALKGWLFVADRWWRREKQQTSVHLLHLRLRIDGQHLLERMKESLLEILSGSSP